MFWRSFAHVVALGCAISLCVFAMAIPRTASAQAAGHGVSRAPPRAGAAVTPPGSTPILSFETDDADEQADAFTAALRAKMRATPGWTLSENTVSLGLLTAALKCRVDAPCLQRVGDQLKADKFFWGRLSRLGKTHVIVEAHYWQRGKHDSVVKETYSDDLRDPNNEALKKIATRVFERLTNTLTTGTLAVQAGRAGGVLYVDGNEAGRLAGGFVSVELKAGPHTVEVRAPGFVPVRRTVNVVVGSETPVSMALAPEPGSEAVATRTPGEKAPLEPKGSSPIVAYTLLGAGVVVGTVGAVFGLQWFGKKGEVRDLKADNYGVPGAASIEDPCVARPGVPTTTAERMRQACDLGSDDIPFSAVGWAAGGAGVVLIGAGVALLVVNKSGSKEAAAAAPKHWALAPAVGPREASLRLDVRF